MTDVNAQTAQQLSDEMSDQRRLGQRMHAFSNMISGHFYGRTEQPLGVSLPEWRVLRSVLLVPGVSQGEVALTEGLNVMNVSRAVAGLRRKKLVEVQADPDDRRRSMMNATDRGREVGVDIGQREHLVYEQVFSVLSPEELQELGALLDRVTTSLRTIELPNPPPPSRDWAKVFREG